jgi:hypothetical protein
MAGAILVPAGMIVSPDVPQTDYAVGPNFERFDGLGQPLLENPAGRDRTDYYPAGPRPGQSAGTPDVYTQGPISSPTGTLGGQPLPVSPRIKRSVVSGPGTVTLVNSPSVQFRTGVGQHGPSSLGAANTVALSEITSSPPVPGDLTSIIAGLS